MNHVKEIELFEARNFKDWNKYNDYLSKKYSDEEVFSVGRKNVVSVMSESNQITISIKYNYTVSNIAILKLCKDFENLNFKLFPSSNARNGSKAVVFEVYNVPKNYFEKIDIELNAEKYNI